MSFNSSICAHVLLLAIGVIGFPCKGMAIDGAESLVSMEDEEDPTTLLVHAARRGDIFECARCIADGANFVRVMDICKWREQLQISFRDPALETIKKSLFFALLRCVHTRNFLGCVRLLKRGADAPRLLKQMSNHANHRVRAYVPHAEEFLDLAKAMAFVEAVQAGDGALIRRFKVYLKVNKRLVLLYIAYHTQDLSDRERAALVSVVEQLLG